MKSKTFGDRPQHFVLFAVAVMLLLYILAIIVRMQWPVFVDHLHMLWR